MEPLVWRFFGLGIWEKITCRIYKPILKIPGYTYLLSGDFIFHYFFLEILLTPLTWLLLITPVPLK